MEDKPLAPGEYLKIELQKRGWTQADFALIVGRHIPVVNEILQGKRAITPELAMGIGMALGTGPELWLNYENAYRLSLLEPDNAEIQRRARLFELAPVKDMEKRGWIKRTLSVDMLEKELCSFFDVDSLESEPSFNALARQTHRADEFTATQRAWLRQAARIASVVPVRNFDLKSFTSRLNEVRALAESPKSVRYVPLVLAELGVRFVIVEPLPRSRIDGAAFWNAQKEPVVVLSLRYDRIDAFWHTLSHELFHIKNQDARSIDVNLVGESRVESLNEIEERADKEGAAFLISAADLSSFMIRTRPFYSKEKIHQFARRMRVHPGVVNGQLQHLKEVGWDNNREMLVKIRDVVVSTAMTDGWGKSAQQFLRDKPQDN